MNSRCTRTLGGAVRRTRLCRCGLFSLLIAVLCGSIAQAQNDGTAQPLREIYIPFDELSVVLEGQPQRVFMTRQEYLDLLAKARRTPPRKHPHDAAVLAARYEGEVQAGRARIRGTLEIDVLAEGLHALPLEFSGVGLLAAQLDGRAAPLALAEAGKVLLFVEGEGRHRLEVDIVAPLETTAALQSLTFQIPTPPATQFALVVPGNVEVRSGADVLRRSVDEGGNETRLELLLRPGTTSLVMTLNNRLLMKQQVVVARSVQVSEVTSAYERLHTSVSFSVLHGAAERFRFQVPDGFEVTEVSSPLLAQWVVQEEEGRRVLEARLSEPSNETVVLNIAAVRTPAVLDNWTCPQLKALDVEAQSSVVGLLLEERLQAHSIAAEGLIRIDNRVLVDALPASVLEAEPGAARLRPIVAYYAPQADFALSAAFERPPARLNVTTTALLTLTDKAQTVQGSFALLSEREKLFSVDFSAPQSWKIASVKDAAGKALAFELYPAADNRTRVRVPLPGVAAGETYSVFFEASHTPEGWLENWEQTQAAFPVFRVEGAARDIGAIAVRAEDDMRVRPETVNGLTPLDERDKVRFALGNVPADLAYRYDDAAYSATLAIERRQPYVTARLYHFLRIGQEQIAAHYELAYDIAEAHTRTLQLSLPSDTPASLSITGLDGLQVSEFTSEVQNERRLWTVRLAQRRQGRVRLAVDFEDRFSLLAAQDQPQEISLPLTRAEDVAYQSGFVAVVGSAELDVTVSAHPRKVDVGELVDAQYQPGKRLLGVFGYLGDTAEVSVRVARHPGYALPATIVQRAELVTLVSAGGLMQTAARYQLRTKAQFLELELPPGSRLWSTHLDGQAGQPQRDDGRILLPLTHASEDALRDLSVVYEMPAHDIGLWQTLEALAPRLYLRTAGSAAEEVPVADFAWHLYVPPGYQLTRTGGTVHTDQVVRRPPPLARLGAALYVLAGGVGESMPAAESTALFDDQHQVFGKPNAAPEEQAVTAESKLPVYMSPSRRTPSDIADTASEPRPAVSPNQPAPPAAANQRARPGWDSDRQAAKQAAQPPASQPGGTKAAQQQAGVATWALEGLRSLKIDIQPSGNAVTFTSLGEEPRLEVTLAHRARLTALAWGTSVLIALYGLRLTGRPARTKFRYVAAVLVIAALAPLLGGWFEELADTFDLAFLTACLLIPYYMVAGAVRWSGARISRVAKLQPVAASTMIAALLLLNGEARAQQPSNQPASEILAELEKLVAGRPVTVPADALIVPYDGDPRLEPDPAQKVLVPYEQYVELWNRAFPDQKLIARPLPAAHALAGARYRATLIEGEHLLIAGQLEVDVYSSEMVAVPLALQGGVLARATVDGQPARLRAVEPAVEGAKARRATAGNLYLLHLEGKGRKRLDLEIRFKLQRQGGWRVAQGRLPAAPATALAITVPLAKTEVRISHTADRRSHETTQPRESIETALGAGGELNLQWRPKVGEGQLDHSLTAESTGVLDVREDALRLHWQMKLDFRRGQREVFTLRVPSGYLVERVSGQNVRGWEVKSLDDDADEQELTVTLLKAARDREELALVLSRRMALGQEEDGPQTIPAPVVRAADAALHRGRLLVRRSPLLDLRILESAGLARTDSPMDQAALPLTSLADESPLGIRPLATYEFSSTPYRLVLEVDRVPAKVRASVQSLLKLSQLEMTLESRVLLYVEGRPLYRVQMLLPPGFELQSVTAPGTSEHAVTTQDDRPLLTIDLAAGATGDVSFIVRGKPAKTPQGEALPVPQLQVLDVQRTEGQIVVQADPAFDVRTSELQNLENILLERTYSWLAPEQRNLARVALAYQTAEHSGQLTLAPRTPRVRAMSISNVRVTDRAIEETILLEFTIHEAGIRQLSFLLPASLSEARIHAPLLRQKTVQPAEALPAGLAGDWVRVSLQLQDEVMGQLRVLVEHDRLLSNQPHEAPLPYIETGTTDARYVTVESAGRDEVIVDEPQGLDVLSRQLSQWRTLTALLGTEITQAYLARESAAQPRLTLRTKDRAAVETVGARVGLAETLLIVDGHGGYRGKVQFHVDNSTEQFLEVALPANARLWTVRVAGEGVKPTADAKAGTVRVPLIKTAPGEPDYLVELKYGGRMPSVFSGREVSFPLVKTVNINVELSQVRLYLPDTHHWFDFGGTMSRVQDKGELTAGFLSYQAKQMERLSQVLSGGDPYAKARAASNLKQLGVAISNYETTQSESEEVRKQQQVNQDILQAAQQTIEQQQAQQQSAAEFDNRSRFNSLYLEQSNTRSKNVVQELGGNFYQPGESSQAPPTNGKFNYRWLEQNKLQTELEGKPGRLKDSASGVDESGKKMTEATTTLDKKAPAQPAAAGIQQKGGEPMAAPEDYDGVSSPRATQRDDSLERLRRYQQRLEEQSQQPTMPPGTVYAPSPAGTPAPHADQPATQPMSGRSIRGGGAYQPAENAAAFDLVPGAEAAAGVPVTLASLDVELPSTAGYREVFFKTPRGDTEITARPLAKDVSERIGRLAYLAAALVLAGLVYFSVRRYGAAILASRASALILLAVGLLSLATFILPIAGLLLAITGFALLAGRFVARRLQPATRWQV